MHDKKIVPYRIVTKVKTGEFCVILLTFYLPISLF